MRHHPRMKPTLALIALALATLLVLTASSYFPSSPPLLPTHAVSAGAVVIGIADATLSADAAGCGLCRDGVSCDHAFKGTPGQFCHALTSGVPCCCPSDSECVESTGASCRCHRSGGASVTTTTTTTRKYSYLDYVVPGLVCLSLIFVACENAYYCFRWCCYGEPFPTRSSGPPSIRSSINSSDNWGSRGYDTTTTTTTTTFGGGDFSGDAGDGGDGGDFGGDN